MTEFTSQRLWMGNKIWVREGFVFGSRQLKVAEMDGRAGAKKKRESTGKRSANIYAEEYVHKLYLYSHQLAYEAKQ